MSRSAARKTGRPDEASRAAAILILGGLALVGGLWRVRMLSEGFVYGSPMLDRPIIEFGAVMGALGLAYAGVAAILLRARTAVWQLAVILAVGVAMRALFFGTNPILEDDYYRYLWDGGTVAHGFNPYRIVPEDAASSPDAKLAALARESGIVIERVNHPSLTTPYPPVAQAAFGFAYAIRPWSLDAWRATSFVVDLFVFVLLLVVLRAAQRPLHWVLIYWWNPLGVMVTANAAHMDVIVLPFVLLALLFAFRKRAIATCVAGALAICAKLWPALLALPLLRYLRQSPGQLATAGIIGGAVLLAVGSPMYAGFEHGDQSGLATYGKDWEMNDALFMGVAGAARAGLGAFGGEANRADLVARWAVAAVLAAASIAASLRVAPDNAALVNRLAIITGVLFMLIPAQFPWYYVWILPFLAVAPRASILSLTVTLPIYYLKFYYSAKGNVDFFHTRVVWLEYAPCLVLALAELGRFPIRKLQGA